MQSLALGLPALLQRNLKRNEVVFQPLSLILWAELIYYLRPGVNLRPGLYLPIDSVYPRLLNEAGLYSEEASIQGNTVHVHDCTS